MQPIYLDYNATTPIAPSVAESITVFLNDFYGNPSSPHQFGRAAREAIEDARSQVAMLLGCTAEEIVFTSGGTESNNLALKGVMLSGDSVGTGHLVVSAIEHAAVSAPARFLQKLGYDVSFVPCDEHGVVHPEAVEAELRADTRLVSVMLANNEVGAIQPIRQIAEICHQRGVLLHSDAAQCIGKIPALVNVLDVDLLSIAGHKFYGPKGVGALFVREGLNIEPATHGAGHENGLRPGTENTPYIVGLGKAAVLAKRYLEEEPDRMGMLRDRLQDALLAGVPGLHVNSSRAERLPNTLSVTFPEVTGYELLQRIPELAASTGTACHSDGVHGSATLQAMGVEAAKAVGTVRLSVGWNTSESDIDRAGSLLIDAWENLSVAETI